MMFFNNNMVYLWLFTVLASSVFAAHEDIRIIGGGYGNILVSVDNGVAYDDKLLEELKEKFVDASEVLYKATAYNLNTGTPNCENSLRFFRNVTVFLPRSWGSQPEIASRCGKPGGLNRHRADFVVGQETAQWGSLPHTDKTDGDCGMWHTNTHVYLPNTFVKQKNANKIGSFGKVMVHEWAIYRYGLFEESTAKDGGNNCQSITIDDEERFLKVRCSKDIDGRIHPQQCKFTHTEIASQGAKGSLMFYGPKFLDKVETFCDSPSALPPDVSIKGVEHDYDVSHPHNEKCDRTGWELLRMHPDFSDHYDGPAFEFDKNFEDALNFQCVVSPPNQATRYVLVMDVSGSMGSGNRLQKLQQSVSQFLENTWEKVNDIGAIVELGMIEFSSSAKVLLNMKTLETEDDKDQMIAAIPNNTGGGTCIDCGIRSALQILSSNGGDTAGAKIYVFTDGVGSVSVEKEVLEAQSIVYSLLLILQSSDHPLIKLADSSGGSSCIYEDNSGTDYYQCLDDIDDDDFLAIIQSSDHDVQAGSNATDTVNIDSSFTEKVRFTLTWPSSFYTAHTVEELDEDSGVIVYHALGGQGVPGAYATCDDLELRVTSPSGLTIGPGDPGYTANKAFRYITVISENNTPGKWEYTISNTASKVCATRIRTEGYEHEYNTTDDMLKQLTVGVSTQPNKIQIDPSGNPLSNTVKILATLKKGNAPVVYAEVVALIKDTAGTTWTIDLLDNGAGADLLLNDGIYSRYFNQFSGDGLYTVTIESRGKEGEVKILLEERHVSEIEGELTITKTSKLEPYESFERTSVGGFFEMDGIPSDIDSIFPPAKISDLQSVGSVSNTSVRVDWTAVGGNLDQGNATLYELRMSQSSAELRGDFSNAIQVNDSHLIAGSLVNPQASGNQESIIVNPIMLGIPLNGTFFVAIKATNSYGKQGEVSNLVIIHFTSDAPGRMPPTEPTESPSGQSSFVMYFLTVVSPLAVACLVGVGVVVTKRKNGNKVSNNKNETV